MSSRRPTYPRLVSKVQVRRDRPLASTWWRVSATFEASEDEFEFDSSWYETTWPRAVQRALDLVRSYG